MEIRRAIRTDASALADLYLRARRAAEPAIPAMVHTDAETHEWMLGQIAESIGSMTLEIWVAAEGDRLLGLMVLDRGWLEQLYIDPGETGGGIGTELLAHAKARRVGGLRLWTFQSNIGAQRFYERHGFEEVDRTDGSGNEEGAPDICYAWRPTSLARPPRRRWRDLLPRSRWLQAVLASLVGLVAVWSVMSITFDTVTFRSAAMEPTIQVDDRLLLRPASSADRGDIVLFQAPEGLLPGSGLLLSRVIGLPGEVVSFVDGTVLIDGDPLVEPYLADETLTLEGPLGEVAVPDGHYFVMGDNRPGARDSRFYGPVPESSIEKRVVLRWWPFSRVGSP